jgi:2-methylisocitrate lyase-like PEP mutase family enzyme
MKNLSQAFKELHQGADPLLIGNVWNVQSAKVFEKLGFKAIATSSAAVAETLGYQDGQEMSFDEYVFIVKRIVKTTSLPVSVDLESGYGKTSAEIAKNILHLHDIGVVGINIEDSGIVSGKRIIADAGEFANMMKEVVDLVNGKAHRVFINLRSDAFLLGMTDPVNEAKRRIALFEKIGVNGLFLPCITVLSDIEAIVSASKLPLNVMCMPALPGFEELKQAGVKRISMGNFLNKTVYQTLELQTKAILDRQSFSSLFES